MEREKIVFLPLHIKLGLMKQFVKVLDTDSDYFEYLCKVFPGLTLEKHKAGIFDGPQIRALIKDQAFTQSMTDAEKMHGSIRFCCKELSWKQEIRGL